MPVELLPAPSTASLPVHLVEKGGLERAPLDPQMRDWAKACGFAGEAGKTLPVPGTDGKLAAALFGTGERQGAEGPGGKMLALGRLAKDLPEGDWHFAAAPDDPDLAALALRLGGYVFTRYGKKAGRTLRFALPQGADGDAVHRRAEAVFLARDLINTPANDLGPEGISAAAEKLARKHGAAFRAVVGEELLRENFPMIHAVGRAGAEAPRLIDISWGRADAPKVTLVGKGVAFDTGGLDIKPSSSMLLMKKDMGGAANVLALADMAMGGKLDVRLRVLVPAVENSISGNAFRPGDVLPSRKGITVEIGNTDAEGRLILADALALADEEEPQLLIDMATLTGAARVALGPEVAPFFSTDDNLAEALFSAGTAVEDPVWRLPLWKPYLGKLSSKIADTNNVTPDGFAGAVTAALFLSRFVEKAASWAHFDIYGWAPSERPHGPAGGEAQAIRAIEKVLARRYG